MRLLAIFAVVVNAPAPVPFFTGQPIVALSLGVTLQRTVT